MWRRLSSIVLAVSLAVTACGGDTPETDAEIAPASGSDTPVGAVEDLVAAINEPNFGAASSLAVPGQAALAALAEGAALGEVAEALENGDQEVAANFWAGFAQGTGSFLTGSVGAKNSGAVSQDGVEFHAITVEPEGGETRTVLVREDDGYRVDIFASFGAGLADRMTEPVERLLTTQTEDARLILAELQTIVPSLLAAAALPDTSPEASQSLISLVEVITRVG